VEIEVLVDAATADAIVLLLLTICFLILSVIVTQRVCFVE
jgi:hypothetical protein